MLDSELLHHFQQDTDNLLIRRLIEAYKNSLNLPQDEQVNRLVEEMKEIFEEKSNASNTT